MSSGPGRDRTARARGPRPPGPAVFGLLVVYCLREPLTTGARLVPALVCTAVTVALQLWKRQMMLSVAIGTGLYMLLLRLAALP